MFFQVNITPKAKEPPTENKDVQEPPPILVLAPFQPQVHINLKTTINTSTSVKFIIKNPSNRPLTLKTSKLPPAERLIALETNEIKIKSESEEQISLTWTPREAGSWRDILQFCDNRRIKYDITLITTSLEPNNKKGNKSKILTQSNVNNESRNGNNPKKLPMGSASINSGPTDRKPPPLTVTQTKFTENKENVVKNAQTINDARVSDNNLRNKQKTTTSNVNLDFSDFQLTPLKPATSRIKVPEIRIDDNTITAMGIRPVSTLPDIQVFEPTEVEFSPRDSRMSSPIYDVQQLRRETYLNPQPKFTERMIFIDQDSHHPTESQEENFEDSLSPVESRESNDGPHNFSTIINSMNFITPVKIKSGDIFSPTSNATDYYSIQSNESFSISEKGSVNSYKMNSTYELLPSPGGIEDKEIKFLPQPHHLKIGLRSAKDGSSTVTLGDLERNTSLSPVSFDNSRLSLSQSIKNGDHASAKEVLEADLWVRENQTQSHSFNNLSSHQFSRSKCNLEIISEEELYLRKTETYRVVKPKILEREGPPLEESSNTETVEARCIEISPPKRIQRSEVPKKPSPIKHNKIMKEKTAVQSNFLNKRKVQLNVKKGNLSIPGVRMSKLSLSGVKSLSNVTSSSNKPIKGNKDKNGTVKLYSPDNIIGQVCNPYVTMKGDPFLSMTLHYDENFLVKQEQEYTKWLNKLMTPPEQLDTDVEQIPIDVGKVWQSCRSKENVLAETKEQVSARYHTNTRLNSLRKAAAAMLRNQQVTTVLTQVTACINKGIFVIRQDRDLHRDIGLQKEILQLFLSYNPLWLRIGLEVIYNEQINLQSNSDIIGLTKFIMLRFFSDPYLVKTYSLHNVTTLRAPEFQDHMNKFILKKFLFLVYFLDYVKRNKLIGYDPCLFLKKASYKDSREILLTFSRHLLSGVGDITKILRSHGYTVTHKQNYIDEFDYAVKDIAVDLRDGVRLCRVMELIKGDKTLTGRCRVPAISRLQKVFNVDLALTALLEAGYTIAGEIDAKSIADGHREKTLSLLWQIIYKFQAPRYEKAALSLQTWWRTKLWYIRVKRYLSNRKNNAAAVIQRTWRCYCGRKLLKELREDRAIWLVKLDKSTRFLQQSWLRKKQMLKDRRRFMDKKAAAVSIQRWFRRIRSSRPYLQDLQRKREAVIIMQIQWRAVVIMRRERNNYLRIKQAAIILQRWWRAASLKSFTRNYYKKLKSSAIFVQSKWRAQKLMTQHRTRYLKITRATVKIQSWWKSYLIGKRVRNDYLLKKDAVRVIKSWWVGCKSRDAQRNKFLAIKNNVKTINRAWKRYRETKNDVAMFKSYCKAARIIQPWWRMARKAREYRLQRNSAIICQRWWRSVLTTRRTGKEFFEIKRSAIFIQKIWKMKKQRRNYLNVKRSVIKIEGWYKNAKYSKSLREEYVRKKNAVKFIESWWRCLKISKQCRAKYLAERRAAIVIQKRWRAKIIGKSEKLKYSELRRNAIKVQACWRMALTRRRYFNTLKRNRAAVAIQRRWRAKVIGFKTRESFIKQRQAAIIIQTRYRAIKITRAVKIQYEALKKAAIILEKNWRRIKASKEFKRQRSAVIVIQSHWRARIIGLNTRNLYVKEREAAIIIQRRYRAIKMAEKIKTQYLEYKYAAVVLQKNWKCMRAFRDYQRQRRAAIVLQTHWRATIIGLKIRQLFVKQRSAGITLQRRYRALKLGRDVKKQFVVYKKAAIIIQKSWRMFKSSQDYQQLRTAAIVLQRQWRARQLSFKVNQEYKLLKKTTIMIQRHYRGRKLARKIRKEYLERRKLAGKIQALWRANKLMKQTREQYLGYRKAAIFLQSRWRMIIARRNYLAKRRAATKIITVWREYIISRNIRNNYLALRSAALLIQRRYRSIRNCEKIRDNFVKLKLAAIFVQRSWRLKLASRRDAADIALERRLITAAIIIQSAYRGFIVRKHQSEEIRKVRERAHEASQAAVPSQTVENRLQDAMSTLQNIKNIGQLSMCLACIDTLTRLSPKGCKVFCQMNLIDTIYNILGNSNRSLPWMEVCLRCISILITIIKLPRLSGYVRNIEETETLARLMNGAAKSNPELFLHLATLLWLLVRDDHFADKVRESPRIIWLIKSTTETHLKKNNVYVKGNANKNKTLSLQDAILPNEKPDWGLKTRRPRYFTTLSHALISLSEILNIIN